MSTRQSAHSDIARTLRSYRLAEALLVSGFIFIGSFFSAPDPAAFGALRPWLFFLAAYLTMLAVYAFNSWAGLREDIANPRLTVAAVAPERRYQLAAAAALAASFALFFAVEPRALPCAAAVFLLSALYSYPKRGTKYVPVAGTLTHIAGGTAQFLTGWTLFGTFGPAAAAFALYFGLILSAGHVNHELIDRDADREAGLVSGAVRFGVRPWIVFHLALTFAAFALLLAVSQRGHLPAAQAAPFLAASAVQSASAFLLFSGAPVQRRFLRHRALYRACYAAAGIAFLTVKAFF